MKCELSLIIPAYNVNPRFLEECFQSVEAQTLPKSDFEVIVFDDGSQDQTPEAAESLSKQLSNARFYKRTNNQGLAATRNQAILEARGKLVALLDADDILVPEALESTFRFMESNPRLRYSSSKHRIVNADLAMIRNVECRPYYPELLLHINFIGPIKCFERDLHLKIGGYDPSLRFGEDWDHALKASENLGSDQIAQNLEYLYLYRIHVTNMTLDNRTKLMAFRSQIITAALARRGISVEAFFSHTTEDRYNYMDWGENGKTSSNTK